MPKQRKHHTAVERVSILRRHFLDKVAISDVCEEQGLHPSIMYPENWTGG